MTDFFLGRRVNHDPRSRAYRVASAAVIGSQRWERVIPVLDQGSLGSCTGNAGTGVLGTQPHYSTTMPHPTFDEAYAVQLYSDASKIDGDPQNYPPTDTGSDGLSVAKILKSRGLIAGYQHAFGISDAQAAIQQGPLMVGTSWYRNMFRPDNNGVVTISGQVDGGHEYECIGYDAASDVWEFVNSWGTNWAKAGHFFMSTTTFSRLLSEQGDVTLLIPVSQPAPVPTADPKAAARTRLDTWAAKRHSGVTKQVAQDWLTVR